MAVDLKAFIAQVLGKISDPGLRTQAEAVFSNAEVQAQLKDGVAGQSEIDRQLQDLRAKTEDLDNRKSQLDERETKLQQWHDGLTTWREQNQEFVELGVAAKKANWKPGDPPPKTGGNTGDPKLPEGVMTEDAFKSAMGAFESSVLGFAADQNLLMQQHFKNFNEILDVTPLIKHPQIRELGLVGVYNLVHKDALEAKTKAAREKQEADIRADERRKVLAEQSTHLPYPITSSGPGSGSPLDGLNAKPDPNAGSLVDRAAAEYLRLQANRPAS